MVQLENGINIMKLLFLTAIIALVSAFSLMAQEFWHTTRDFPGGVKTSFAAREDSILVVGTADGIWLSHNEGFEWEKKLASSHISSLLFSSSGTLIAGGNGKIFFSENEGSTWDSVGVGTIYPIRKIIENKDQTYFFIASGFTNEEGFVGDGVFYSGGDIKTWESRNTGLPTGLLAAEQLAVDKNGRVYVSLPDENTSGKGGLYFSDDMGMTWRQSALLVDNLGTIKVLNSFGISITPEDSVVVSVAGTNVNFSTRLNLVKHINDVSQDSPWKPWSVRKVGNWWDDLPLNEIHFAKNGDWYSSVSSSRSSGGSFYSTDKGMNWVKRTAGMGISQTDRFERNFHYESSAGKIFLVQLLDERVYYTNQSLLAPVIISGKVTDDQGKALTGVTIQAKNNIVRSNSNGEYEVVVPTGWSGRITPTLGNYEFSPAFESIQDAQNQTQNINFVGTYTGTYFISGKVSDVINQPIAQIPLSGFSEVVYTNDFGYYVGEVPARWTGTITPELTGYESNPGSMIYVDVRSDLVDQNFLIRKIGSLYIIGIVNDENGQSFPGVTLTGFPETTRVDQSGKFFGEVTKGWTGSITPVAEGYTFVPNSLQVTNLQSDLVNQVFVAIKETGTYLLSGYIKDERESPVHDVLLTGLPSEVRTLEDGSYRIELPKGWTGVITPKSEKYTFEPVSIPINVLSGQLDNQSFVAHIVTGIEDEELDLFDVYPNPSRSRSIHIRSEYIGNLTVFDSSGRRIWSGNSKDAIGAVIHLNSSGVFFVSMSYMNRVQTRKIIVF